jgi:hypothetical protein
MSIPLSGAPFGHLRPTYEARQLFQEKRQFCLVLRLTCPLANWWRVDDDDAARVLQIERCTSDESL